MSIKVMRKLIKVVRKWHQRKTKKKRENKKVGGHDSNKKKMVSLNDTREPGGNFVNLGW